MGGWGEVDLAGFSMFSFWGGRLVRILGFSKIQFCKKNLEVLGADVLCALVEAKLDQLKVHRVQALLPEDWMFHSASSNSQIILNYETEETEKFETSNLLLEFVLVTRIPGLFSS